MLVAPRAGGAVVVPRSCWLILCLPTNHLWNLTPGFRGGVYIKDVKGKKTVGVWQVLSGELAGGKVLKQIQILGE